MVSLRTSRQSGVTLIEVIIAVGIITVMLVAVGLSVTAYMSARSELLSDAKSLYLAEEGYEFLRLLREEDWTTLSSLTVGTTYYFDIATTTIALGGAAEVIDDEYYRSFVLQNVYRDGSDDITASTTAGATLDADTLHATVSVFGPTGTTSLEAIIANIHAI